MGFLIKGISVTYQKMFVMAMLLSVMALTLWTNNGSANSLKTEVRKVCKENFIDKRGHLMGMTELPIIYYVTPTYPRPEQVPELTRLSHTLMHVPRIHWIVSNDDAVCSDLLLEILNKSGLPYTLLASPKPDYYMKERSRGVSNRRAALSWLQTNVHQGVLYFGDDDNTVDLQLFDEIRNTKKVSMFPVGLIKGFGVSTPLVENGKVFGFFDSWPASRTFPVDMAGFAVNIAFLKPGVTMPYKEGYEEDKFLRSIDLTMEDIEPVADNCTKILVWHTKTVKNTKPTLKVDVDRLQTPMYSNFVSLLKQITRMHIADISPDTGVKAFFTHHKHRNPFLSPFPQ
ncbi:galactosylgalactosylxylosylprotein 3-beta-glucuronosyltransferase S-like isoform X2 [Plodia interpunctella]|uniref:galactosylgalactosylxylosylprotein 3-beta-glucuronosyltransferase S-like isoform X2 n=1 Tax=Plodia interpunctella TaxID=58824 RepID=UPI00236832E5|nr:galactosylgalactosylxylosylprotein 3-beta-glucuronosyltransferase S-like isoform X2 [Plodia interpunctella]